MSETQALELLTKKLKTSGKQLEESDVKSAQALAEASRKPLYLN